MSTVHPKNLDARRITENQELKRAEKCSMERLKIKSRVIANLKNLQSSIHNILRKT